MAYAGEADVSAYIPAAVEEIWGGDIDMVTDSLDRASNKIDDRLRGLDRFSDDEIPVAAESGSYPEILIKLNVYEAVWQRVTGTRAGEAFEEHWSWIPSTIRDIWGAIEAGRYAFGESGEEGATQGSYSVGLRRKSP